MQNNSKNKHYGITPPISMKAPTAMENSATASLINTLKSYDQYETDEEAQQRQIVLGKLHVIFKEFVKNISIKNGLPEELANEVGGKIFTFGSYRLGVHGRGSDIDTLCVAPKHVKREDFLEHMYNVLKARSEVSEITAVPEAYVPIIKMVFSGISIDLIFARLAESSVPDNLNLSDDKLLRNIDERCVRSLNGSRVTDDILRLVPNVEAFRTALRCVKVWAKARAIYSNVMGFFGGVAWAIVVARVCQMFPNATASAIVAKFFRIMHEWAWPQPVLLKLIEEGPLAVRVWNPKIYPQDKSHRMPVITPAYPSMCSTHNVTVSNLTITTQEFGRAAEITDRILVGTENWTSLFQKTDFFHRYKYYLQVCVSSTSADGQLKWAGLVESKLRQLIMKLELVENLEIVHPFIKPTERYKVCHTEEEKRQAQQGKVVESSPANGAGSDVTMEDANGDSGATPIWTSMFYIGLQPSPKDPSAPSSGRKLDITWPINEFHKMVKASDLFDPDRYYIHTNHLKSAQLPLDVYDESEIPRVLKKRSKLQTKSRASNVSVTENPSPKRRRGSVAENGETAVGGGGAGGEETNDATAAPTPATVDVDLATTASLDSSRSLENKAPPKEGSLSYQEAIAAQEAARRSANYGGMALPATNRKEIVMKMGSSKK